MAPTINAGAKEAVKAFVKQIRRTGMGDKITQKLENGATLEAYRDKEMLNIYHMTTNSNGATMTDVFESALAEGSPKHVRSGICSPNGGSLFYWPGKKGFLGLFGSKPSRVIVDNRDYTGECKSEFIAELNGSATKAKSVFHKTGSRSGNLVDQAIGTARELKEAIMAVIENKPL